MTAAELMEVRFEVTALWPNTDFKLHQVLSNLGPSAINYYRQWPHLFRELKWYEERKQGEMPEYVKQTHEMYGLKVFKIKSIDYKYMTVMLDNYQIPSSLIMMEPATEKEYNEYHKTKK